MKSTVEKLSPTRVRINVEVPFTELQPDFDRAYKELAKQVRLPGFRPGKAPAKLLEARIGRGAVLEQVVNDALPSRYSEAVTATEVTPLGQPEIEVTKIEDGEELVFTAEVDVRPEIDLPDLSALKIEVEAIEINDEEVDAELESLRARFGTLKGVERPAQTGDFVSIDLSATVDGEELPDAATEGLSHEVGSGQLIDGLDDAIVGLSEGESKVFTTAGRRRARWCRRRGHRHGQVDQGARASRGRRRVRPAGKRVRHHRGAAREPRRAGEARQAHPAGREDPRQRPRAAAGEDRGPAARGDRASPGRPDRAQRDPRSRP